MVKFLLPLLVVLCIAVDADAQGRRARRSTTTPQRPRVGAGYPNQRDFNDFRAAYGMGYSDTFDFNGDGQVDQVDFDYFRKIYNVTPGIYQDGTNIIIVGTDQHDDVGISLTPIPQIVFIARDDAGSVVFQKIVPFNTATTAVFFHGNEGNDRFNANDINCPVHAWGNNGGDQLQGGNGNDYIYGNAGQDTLRGHAGTNRIDGGPDMDWIYGGVTTGPEYLKPGDEGLNFIYPYRD